MSEKELEKEIQDKGLTAPRLTPALIDATIKDRAFHVFEETCLTVCCLTLKNGYTVSGESACASPENFDAKIGESIAFENARNKIWALEGYLLKDALHKQLNYAKPVTAKARAQAEQADLRAKLTALVDYFDTEAFSEMDIVSQGLLTAQSDHMLKYLGVLEHRISIWED